MTKHNLKIEHQLMISGRGVLSLLCITWPPLNGSAERARLAVLTRSAGAARLNAHRTNLTSQPLRRENGQEPVVLDELLVEHIINREEHGLCRGALQASHDLAEETTHRVSDFLITHNIILQVYTFTVFFIKQQYCRYFNSQGYPF